MLVTDKSVTEVVNLLSELPRGVGHPIAIDCETTGLNPYQGDVLRGFSIAFRLHDQVHSFYIPVGYPEGNIYVSNIHRICLAINEVDPTYVYHHAKFDLRFLRQLPRRGDGGVYFPVPPVGRFWDTKIVAWLIDENLSTSLKPIAARLWGEDQLEEQKAVKALIKLRGGWDKLTVEDTATYGAKDAEQTIRLMYHQRQVLYAAFQPMLYGNPRAAVAREFQVQALLLRMEDNGIMVDSGYLEELLETSEKSCAEIEALMLERYSVNVNSPKQVAGLLFDTLEITHKGEGRSVARQVLENLDDPSGTVDLILQHRRLRKSISSYLRPLAEKVCADDRLHPTFWQHGTVTGRFSCSDPNLQTIPREDVLPGVRATFVAPDGYELWEFDLQAAEMRVVAGMANEQVLIAGLNAGTDMHGLLASQVFGPEYTGVQRRYAKNIGYGFFYGLTSPVTAAKYIAGANATKTAKRILDGLRELYPNVVRLMRQSSRMAEKQGYIRVHETAWPGRFRRYVTEAEHAPFPYTALNAQVQGGIGELMKDVMLAMEPGLDNIGARLLLQVHDSLVIELPEGRGEDVLQAINFTVNEINPFAMPMIFDGKPWGEHE